MTSERVTMQLTRILSVRGKSNTWVEEIVFKSSIKDSVINIVIHCKISFENSCNLSNYLASHEKSQGQMVRTEFLEVRNYEVQL